MSLNQFLNNPKRLWAAVLCAQVVIILTYILFFHLRLGNTALFFIPAWFCITLTIEFVYLLHQRTSKAVSATEPETRHFGAGWVIWLGVIFTNIGIALFFFTEYWFAGLYALVPLSLGYLVYLYKPVFISGREASDSTA